MCDDIQLLFSTSVDILIKMINEAKEATKCTIYQDYHRGNSKDGGGAINDERDEIYKVTDPVWVRGWKDKISGLPHEQWLNFGLIVKGETIKINADLCPTIMEYILNIKYKFNYVGLTYLPPGGVIDTHIDNPESDTNTYTFHLGLIGDENSILKVGDIEYKHALPGKLTYFYDHIPHSAINKGKHGRIIIYMK